MSAPEEVLATESQQRCMDMNRQERIEAAIRFIRLAGGRTTEWATINSVMGLNRTARETELGRTAVEAAIKSGAVRRIRDWNSNGTFETEFLVLAKRPALARVQGGA